MFIRDLLTAPRRATRTVPATTTIREAIRLLFDSKKGLLLIRNKQNQLCGTTTERDILRALGTLGRQALDMPVSRIMALDLVVVSPDHSLEEAMALMGEHNLRQLPVVDERGRLIGLVNTVDLVRAAVVRTSRSGRNPASSDTA